MRKLNSLVGVGCILLAAILNGLLPLMVTTIYQNGGHFTNIMFYKGVFVIPIAWVIAKISHQSVHLSLRQHLSCVVISVLQYVTSLLLYGSYQMISTGIATSLHFMYPIIVMIIDFFVFRKRPQKKGIITLMLCICGVFLMCNNGSHQNNALGALIALLSGIVYAGYFIVVERSQARTLPSAVFSMYIFFYMTIISGMVSLCSGTLNGLNGNGWTVAAVSAVAAGIVAAALQAGIVSIGSQTASILSVAEPLVSVLVGALFLNESFTFRSVCGTLCIVSSVVLTALSQNPQEAGCTD